MIFQTPQPDAAELEAIGRIDAVRSRLQNILGGSPKLWQGFLRRNAMARNLQGSNTIEGYNVTFEEAVEVIEGEATDIQNETLVALMGYRSAMSYILQLSDDKDYRFNEELIRGLHYMMMSYDPLKHPGRWRPGPIFVRREPSGERVYEGPDAGLVPELMREFVQCVDSDITTNPIIRAAMAHLNLVMIHPFSDGNGRMGRALQTLVLARGGILQAPFSSIEEYLGSRNNTEAYYSVLAQVGIGSWHPEQNARQWVRFCLRAHLQQASTLERRVKETARLWSDLEAELKRRNLDERMINALYEAAIGFRVSSARYRIAADISSQAANNDLRALVKDGLLSAKGERRGRVYFATPLLREIREKTREPRTAPSAIFEGQLGLFSQ